MNEEIRLENNIYRKVKLKKVIRKLFIFKDKRDVLVVALIGQVLGYTILAAGLVAGVYINLQPGYYQEPLYRDFLQYLLIASGSLLIYILACVLINKLWTRVFKHKK